MKKLILYISFIVLFACKNTTKQIPIDSKSTLIHYSEAQLLSFFDSVSNLPQKPIIQKVNSLPDSIFLSRKPVEKLLSVSDFERIKKAISQKEIGINTAKLILGDLMIDSSFLSKGTVPINFVSFDSKESDFKEFAIYVGSPEMQWESEVFFFNSNYLVAKHTIYHRYGLEIEHYKDSDGKTIIYYKENFESGSGVWWFNFYFYKYIENQLIPILNVLENGNLQYPWHTRSFYFESIVENTNPLILKMTYSQELANENGERHLIVNDSTFVEYHWDENFKILHPNYSKSKLTEAKILTFYLLNSELLFINEYCKTLKEALNNKTQKPFVLNYLNSVKNQYNMK